MSIDLQQFPHVIPPTAMGFSSSGTDKSKQKREKTTGEKLFDWSVYGGIGWGVNAALSLKATDWLEHSANGQALALGATNALTSGFKKLPFIKDPKAAAATTFFIGALYTGGTMLIPVMKLFEDHKGSLVRFADRVIHGKKAETDPNMVQAHKEMDEAPKQSWGSMIKARLLSFPAGLFIGKAVGSADAWSSKLVTEGSLASKFATFERAGATISRGVAEAVVSPHAQPNGKLQRFSNTLRDWGKKLMIPQGIGREAWLKNVHFDGAHPHKTVAPNLFDAAAKHDPRPVRNVSNSVYELLLSSFVAFGFYLTSHAFARIKDEKQQAKQQVQENKRSRVPIHGYLPERTLDTSSIAPLAEDAAPATTVSNIQRVDERVNRAPVADLSVAS